MRQPKHEDSGTAPNRWGPGRWGTTLPAGVIEPGQLTKLASELEVLLRTGSPLGPGLRDASRRWRGSLRPAAEKLAFRLDSGVPVDEALRSSPELPPIFRSLAAAGLATNRAADVLEAYSSSTRQLLSLRERLLRGLMYPAIVVIMAYALFILLASAVLPQMAEIVSDFSEAPPWWVGTIEQVRVSLPIWSWAIPLGVIAVWSLSKLVFGRGAGVVGWWGILPGVHGTLTDIHTATASQLLAALLECDVPLPLALSLASESLESNRTRAAVQAVADDVRLGIPSTHAFRTQAGAPPLWRALFAREAEPAAIQGGLMHVAEILSERARNRADLIGRILPLVLVVVIGGVTVFGYATIVFGPLIAIWNRVGGPS